MAIERTDREFWLSVSRAFAGAIIFSFPLLMTMEMWWLGFYMSRFRLALMVLVLIPVLIGLSVISGFDKHWHFVEATLDSFVAFAVGFTVATLMLFLFGEVGLQYSLYENVGKISLQTIPAAIGAMISRSLLDAKGHTDEARKHEVSLASRCFCVWLAALS